MLRQELLLFDHDVLQGLKAKESFMKRRYKALILGGIGLIFLSGMFAIGLEDVLQIENERFGAIYLFLITISVFMFIYAGCMMNNYSLLTDNQEYHAKRKSEEKEWILIVVTWIITAGYIRAKRGKE